jgi:APA family basic amino acid/polyamine antiporter
MTIPVGYGPAMAVYLVISSMVGVGVLTTSGFTVASVGSNQLMLVLWIVGGVVALCGALTVAEVAAALPASGGDYIYLYEAFGPLVAFLSGWVSFLIGFAGPIAASAFASASYLLAPIGLGEPTATLAHKGLATVSILTFAIIHVSGTKHTNWAHSGVTLVKLGVLVSFLLVGLAAGWRNSANLIDQPPIDGKVLSSMILSLVYISYAYTGWNAATYMAGEVRDPGRTVPRAILIGSTGVTLLYLGLNTVYALALPAAEIQKIAKENGFNAVAPIAELAAKQLFSPSVAAPFSVLIGLTLLASMSAYILTGPRVSYAMARAGHFPAIAGQLWKSRQTPAVATALQVAWALFLLWMGSFENILVYASVGLALFSMLSVSSIFVLRRTRPDLHRPFRTPGYPVVPAIFLTGTGMLTFAAFFQRPWVSLLSLLSILVGVPIYRFFLRGASRRLTQEPSAVPAVESPGAGTHTDQTSTTQ